MKKILKVITQGILKKNPLTLKISIFLYALFHLKQETKN
jgi:hypothetical protein